MKWIHVCVQPVGATQRGSRTSAVLMEAAASCRNHARAKKADTGDYRLYDFILNVKFKTRQN